MISSSVVPFSSCPQSFPASGSFQMSQFFTSGGQKYWSFSFSISPSSEYSGLNSFRMDWLDLLAVQGTRKSLLQCHSLKASILRPSNVCLIKVADAGSLADVRSRSWFGASPAAGRLARWQRRQRRAGNPRLLGARPSGGPCFS